MAQLAIDVARTQVAALIGASAREIVWISGATEANNLALKGIATSAAPGSRILIASTEHKAVLDTAYALEASEIKVEELAVGNDGLVDVDAVRQRMAEDVVLVSVMHANNETGVLQPIEELARLAHDFGALLHTRCDTGSWQDSC